MSSCTGEERGWKSLACQFDYFRYSNSLFCLLLSIYLVIYFKWQKIWTMLLFNCACMFIAFGKNMDRQNHILDKLVRHHLKSRVPKPFDHNIFSSCRNNRNMAVSGVTEISWSRSYTDRIDMLELWRDGRCLAIL